jgi:hypothetical protein
VTSVSACSTPSSSTWWVRGGIDRAGGELCRPAARALGAKPSRPPRQCAGRECGANRLGQRGHRCGEPSAVRCARQDPAAARSGAADEVPADLDVVLHLGRQFTSACPAPVPLVACKEHRRQFPCLERCAAHRARRDEVIALRHERGGLLWSDGHQGRVLAHRARAARLSGRPSPWPRLGCGLSRPGTSCETIRRPLFRRSSRSASGRRHHSVWLAIAGVCHGDVSPPPRLRRRGNGPLRKLLESKARARSSVG